MYFYRVENDLAVSALPDLPFETAEPGTPALFLTEREGGPAVFRVTRSHHLTDPAGVRWLTDGPALDRPLTAVNLRHPRWQDALAFTAPKPGKKRVHLLAVGDVGGTLLTALKLLGGDCISAIGIRDLNENTVARWVTEMGQVAWPWDYGALPEVEAIPENQLFDCDVFIFAATKAIPAVGSIVQDVRMAQFAANRPLAEHFAKQAREARFGGLFVVLSDPVDPLCKAAWLASNAAPDGTLDHRGLLPEQVQGFGLGVMNARAAYFAKQNPRFASFLTEGRAFGPHGEDLVLANSIAHYDDALSRELTEKVAHANLEMRKLGYKPYVAPALSSGALSLLALLRGQWHYSSVYDGQVFMGCRNRLTPAGIETEPLTLPPALQKRIDDTRTKLNAIE